MIVFMNGQFVEEEQALVSVFDRGFLYGDGLFETLRVVHGKPFRWEQHLQRLQRGAQFLNIRPPWPTDSWLGFAEDLSAHRLVLKVDCDPVALGIGSPPPWRWEVWRGNEAGWELLQVASDTTAGLHERGEIIFYLPYRCAANRINLREGGTWLRCSPCWIISRRS